MRCGEASRCSGPIGARGAHDTAPALTIAPCSPPDVHGKDGPAAAGGLQCSRLWESIQSGQPRTNSRPTAAARDPPLVNDERTSGLAAQAETERLRIAQSDVGRELIVGSNSFEVDFTSAGNMRVDVRSKDHHGDLVIATALALWSAVGRPSGRIEVVKIENFY